MELELGALHRHPPGRGFIGDVDEFGEPVIDDTFLVLLNASTNDVEFKLPSSDAARPWQMMIDTNWTEPPPRRARPIESPTYSLVPRSLVLLRRRAAGTTKPKTPSFL